MRYRSGWSTSPAGDCDRKISSGLRKEIAALVGEKLNPARLDDLARWEESTSCDQSPKGCATDLDGPPAQRGIAIARSVPGCARRLRRWSARSSIRRGWTIWPDGKSPRLATSHLKDALPIWMDHQPSGGLRSQDQFRAAQGDCGAGRREAQSGAAGRSGQMGRVHVLRPVT